MTELMHPVLSSVFPFYTETESQDFRSFKTKSIAKSELFVLSMIAYTTLLMPKNEKEHFSFS